MPRTLFGQVLVTRSPPRSPRWMKLGSLAVHLFGVLLLMVLPITAAFDLPSVHTRLPPVMLATVSTPPPPPQVRPPAAASTIPATVPVPLTPPDGIQPEAERPPTVVPLGAPGGIGDGVPSLGATTPGTMSLPPPPPQPVPPRRVGGNIRPPERTMFTAPTYPPAARAARVEGIVVLEAIIDSQGMVRDVTVLRSIPLLDRAAIEAVQQWRYTPTRLNGVAIPIVMTVSVRFSIR